ncbi:MAG TPA: tyrosine-type recombinase/integrase [Nakamurella sp.]|nr:tyrosine-type recombinase/integrase [Nakamurella sp.]
MDVVDEFVEHLVVLGRSSYTVRTYRLGVNHFRRWLKPKALLEVSRSDVAGYVGAFEAGAGGRAPRTVNQRLAALAAFYGFVIGRDTQLGSGRWRGEKNPVPTADDQGLMHGMPGRDLPRRTGLELRRREPRVLPRDLDPAVAERLAVAPSSARDRAIVTLLLRTGQRIGDWSGEHGRHGVLGMRLSDVDRRRRSVTVRLKGARDEHRVPVTDDWWPLLDAYLRGERGSPATDALWVGRRQAAGRPLRYPAFEAMLRSTAAGMGVKATAHMFRHTVAQQLVDVAGLSVAQQVLGHRQVSTTADSYAHVDEPAMLAALKEVAKRQRRSVLHAVQAQQRYVFPYSPATIAALEALTGGGAP